MTNSGGTTPYSYHWSNGATSQNVSSLASGTYSVTVTDSKGCVMAASASVIVPTQISGTTLITNASCSFDIGNIVLTPIGGSPGYTYLWSNGATSQNISSLAPNIYSVTIKDTMNCSATISATIIRVGNVPTVPSAISGSTYVCKSVTGIVFSSSVVSGATSYTWTLPSNMSGTSTTNSIIVATNSSFTGGIIKVKANNYCGSGTDATLMLTVPTSVPSIPGIITGANNFCIAGSNTYSIAPVISATGYFWSVSVGSGLTILSGQNTPSVVVSATNGLISGTISVYAINCKGNSAVSSKIVYGSAITSPSFICGGGNDNKAVVCGGSMADYEICSVNGAISYTWTAPAGAIISDGIHIGNPITMTSGNPNNGNEWEVSVIFPLNFISGNITVYASNGCSNSAVSSFAVRSKPSAPGIISGPTSNVCKKSGQVYSVAAVTGATFYIWTVPSGVTINTGYLTNSISVTYGNSFVGTGIITVKANNNCGSSAASSITVNAATLAPGTITGPSSACKSTTKTYSVAAVTGATSYKWTASNGATFVGSSTGASVSVKFTAVSTLSVGITCKAKNACASSAASSLTVSVLSNCREDQDGNIVNSDYLVYPNPTSGIVNIELNNRSDADYTFKVMDVQSKVVYKNECKLSAGPVLKSLDLSGLANGVYFIQIDREGIEVKMLKIVVQ